MKDTVFFKQAELLLRILPSIPLLYLRVTYHHFKFLSLAEPNRKIAGERDLNAFDVLFNWGQQRP